MSFVISAGEPPDAPGLSPEAQSAVWFLGALVTIRIGGTHSGGSLAILDHTAERGYHSPRHVHSRDEETFFVLDGELRLEIDDQTLSAGPGVAVVLPRARPHAFVVTSPAARFLTLHTPAGFEGLVRRAGTPAASLSLPPVDLLATDPVELAALAAHYEVEITGPPPSP
ncbi:MAG: cupin domain-containing protein [Mycobacterium sp.]